MNNSITQKPVIISNRKDVLLLLLYSPGRTKNVNESITGRTRLVKMLFLFKEEVLNSFKKNVPLTDSQFYEFVAWNYGPFSKQVYDDLNFLILREYITVHISRDKNSIAESVEEYNYWLNSFMNDINSDEFPEYCEEDFSLTEKGKDYSSKLFENLTENQKTILIEFKRKLSEAPLRAILKYVYSKYPHTTTKSFIRNNVLGGV